MRYSKEHKQETHARIVKKASVRLREKGAHGIGVADLMKEAGLTHGGFYAHFDSREALVIEAFAYAMDRSIEHWRKIAAETPPEKRLSTIVDSYVSTPCIATIPAAAARFRRSAPRSPAKAPKTRKAFAAKLEQMIDMMADQIPDVPRKTARKQAMAHAGDHDGHAGDVPHRGQRRTLRRNSRRRPRGGAGPRRGDEAGREEGAGEGELNS